MQKILLAMFVCLFSVGAFAACDESGKGKEKQEEDKRTEVTFRERMTFERQ